VRGVQRWELDQKCVDGLMALPENLAIEALQVNTLFRHVFTVQWPYGVASIKRLLEIIGLVCKRALLKRLHSAKDTYNFKKPTNRSHPIVQTCVDGLMALPVNLAIEVLRVNTQLRALQVNT